MMVRGTEPFPTLALIVALLQQDVSCSAWCHRFHLLSMGSNLTCALAAPVFAETSCTLTALLHLLSPSFSPAGKAVIRPYTPTSPLEQKGSFDLIVKAYPGGKVSKHFAGLQPGDVVECKGPFKKFDYVPNGWRAVGMVAGGSGITPMYQLIHTILSNPRDKTEIRLVYASRSEEDIILKEELDALAVLHPQFKVVYTVDAPKDAAKWQGKTGYISKDMLASFLPPPQAEGEELHYKVLVCGPPGMMKTVSGEKKSPADQGELTGLLKDMKYSQAQVFKY